MAGVREASVKELTRAEGKWRARQQSSGQGADATGHECGQGRWPGTLTVMQRSQSEKHGDIPEGTDTRGTPWTEDVSLEGVAVSQGSSDGS